MKLFGCTLALQVYLYIKKNKSKNIFGGNRHFDSDQTISLSCHLPLQDILGGVQRTS